MFCSDSHPYVVKFLNNPQGGRVLANELFVARVAHYLGLPVPAVAVVNVSADLIRLTPELNVELRTGRIACSAGPQFGSKYIPKTLDFIPRSRLRHVANKRAFAGAVVLDKWAANLDTRQAIFKRGQSRNYVGHFIDNGLCLGGPEWKLTDSPKYGTYPDRTIYEEVTDWDCFEPYLTRLEHMDPGDLWRYAADIPSEWYDRELGALGRLLEQLDARRANLRDLIGALRDGPLRPFPNWNCVSFGFSTGLREKSACYSGTVTLTQTERG